MNTSISDMASFPIPPLGSHWSHESDLIGDLFDLTICIIIFRCPTDGISIALVQSEAIIFKIVPIGFEIYICMLAVRPAVSHMLSLRACENGSFMALGAVGRSQRSNHFKTNY